MEFYICGVPNEINYAETEKAFSHEAQESVRKGKAACKGC